MFRCFFLVKKWMFWSWFGTFFILAGTWLQVSIDVRINEWFGEFYNTIQAALAKPDTISIWDFYKNLMGLAEYAGYYVFIAVVLAFFSKHWTFRWREALNEYYLEHWKDLRHIEGASQRVQEDTKQFSTLIEMLGGNLVESLFTLFAFLPILWQLSKAVKVIPYFGAVEHSLVFAAIIIALFGTVLLALVGWKLPGLEFQNQRVEASYRKELVYAEDDATRGERGLLRDLFANIRKNYFSLYFHYLYFDVVKYSYLQFSIVIPYLLLGPTIVSGVITLGILQQIVRAFQRVEMSFQFLVRSWSTLVQLMSVFNRLNAFEAHLKKVGAK